MGMSCCRRAWPDSSLLALILQIAAGMIFKAPARRLVSESPDCSAGSITRRQRQTEGNSGFLGANGSAAEGGSRFFRVGIRPNNKPLLTGCQLPRP
ncbi:hypothetical protein HDV57DRAFT_89928 [Trichoderma longibrachiatum]